MALSDTHIVMRSLTSRAFATVTTVLMVAVAVALLVSLLSLRASGQRALERGVGNAHLIVAAEPGPMNTVLNHLYFANPPRAAMALAEYERLRNAHPWAWTVAMAQGDSFRGYPVAAVEAELFDVYQPVVGRPMAMREGAWIEAGEAGDWQVVLGAEVARRTGVRVGQGLYLTHGVGARAATGGDITDLDSDGNPVAPVASDADPNADRSAPGFVHTEFVYRVVGVLEPTGTAFDRALFTNLRSTWIKHAHDKRVARLGADLPLTTYDDLTPNDLLVTAFIGSVLTRPGQQIGAALPAVFESIRRDGRTVANPGEQIRRLLDIVGNVDEILIAMAAVVLVASGAGILLALVSSMEQRRRQIAVLRALGASRGRIFGLIMVESAAIGFVGALAGVAIAWVGVGLIGNIMAERTGLAIEAGVGLRDGALIVLVAVLVAQASGLIPALMAYRTSVVRALRPLG